MQLEIQIKNSKLIDKVKKNNQAFKDISAIRLFWLDSQVTLTTVLSVTVVGHEDTGTTGLSWTLSSESLNLTILVNLVVSQDSEFDLFVLVFDLLWSGVDFFLSLLTTTSQSENQVKSGLLLDVVVRQSSTILQLLTGKDQSLLVWWDTLFVLDLGLDVVNGVGGLNLQGNGLTCKGFDENLHLGLSASVKCVFLTKLLKK